MPITFENDNDVIIYALECVISHARRSQQIFGAQCVWWLASIIGLEQGLLSHIDRPQAQGDTILIEQLPWEVSATPRDLTEDQRVDQVLDCTEQYLRESKQLREIASLNISGKMTTGRINPLGRIETSLKKAKRICKDVATNKRKDYSKTEGIDDSESSRRKAVNECWCCAWPFDRKGNHRVKDCVRWIKLDKGTAIFPKDRNYQKPTDSSEGSDPAESSNSEDNID